MTTSEALSIERQPFRAMTTSEERTETTLPMNYGKWTIKRTEDIFGHRQSFVCFPTEEGIQHDYELTENGHKYCGNCLWADSVEEAKELIDEKTLL